MLGAKASRQQRALRQDVPTPDDINLVAEVVAIEGDIIDYRRHIHMYPELQYEEVRGGSYNDNLKRSEEMLDKLKNCSTRFLF